MFVVLCTLTSYKLHLIGTISTGHTLIVLLVLLLFVTVICTRYTYGYTYILYTHQNSSDQKSNVL
jgi:hypothetical protein